MKVPEENTIHTLADGRIEVVPDEGLAVVDGVVTPMQQMQFNVLKVLAARADSTVKVTDACIALWDRSDPWTEATLRVHVSNVRKALGDELGDTYNGVIRTKRRMGYQAQTSLGGRALEDVSTPLPEESRDTVHSIAGERIVIDTDGLTVRRDGQMVDDLTATEFELLAELARHPNMVISYYHLFNEAGVNPDVRESNSGPVMISTLRKKLGDELGDRKTGAIRNRHRVGYYAVSSLTD